MSKVKTAKSLLEQMNKRFGNKYAVNESELMDEPEKEEKEKEGEEEIKEEDEVEVKPEEKEENIDDNGEVATGAMGIIEKLISENFGSDMEAQKKAVEEMKCLAESEEPVSNKFMEMLSDVTSAMKMEEDADGEYMVVFEPEKWSQMSEKYKAKK